MEEQSQDEREHILQGAHDQRVAQAMQRFGGGFVEKLGVAIGFADHHNRRKLREAFPELWEKYGELARQVGERG